MPKEPDAADITQVLIDRLNYNQFHIDGRHYETLACYNDVSDYQTIFLELLDCQEDGPEESIEYTIKVTKKRKKKNG